MLGLSGNGTHMTAVQHEVLIGDAAAPYVAGVRHYLVNSPHMDMAQHKTTYALLRELLPLHGCSPGELQKRLDMMTQHAFVAGALHCPSLTCER